MADPSTATGRAACEQTAVPATRRTAAAPHLASMPSIPYPDQRSKRTWIETKTRFHVAIELLSSSLFGGRRVNHDFDNLIARWREPGMPLPLSRIFCPDCIPGLILSSTEPARVGTLRYCQARPPRALPAGAKSHRDRRDGTGGAAKCSSPAAGRRVHRPPGAACPCLARRIFCPLRTPFGILILSFFISPERRTNFGELNRLGYRRCRLLRA